MSTQDDAMKALMGMVAESDRATVTRNLNYGDKSRGGIDAMSTSERPLDRNGIRNFMMNGDFSTNGAGLSPEEMQKAMLVARGASIGANANEYGAPGIGNLNFIQEPVYDMNQPQYQTPGQVPGQQMPMGGYPPAPYGYAMPYPPQYPQQTYPPQPYPNSATPPVPQVPMVAQLPQPASVPQAQQQVQRPTPKNAAEAVYQLYDTIPASLQRIEENQMLILSGLKELRDSLWPSEEEESEAVPFPDHDDINDVPAEEVVLQILPGKKDKKVVESK